jgi:hypothetical protein
MIFRNKEGKYIGSFTGVSFRKTVYRSTHMLRSPQSWAIDSDVVKTLELLNGKCKKIIVYDKENNVTYQVDFALFLEKMFVINRGYGNQQALPLVYWKFKLAKKGERFKKFTDEAYYLAHQENQVRKVE